MYINNNVGQGLPHNFDCRIKKMFIIPTQENGYQDVMQRSFCLNANAGELVKIEAMFGAQQTGLNNTITESVLSKAVPNLVTLNSTPIGRAEIANGWQTSRFRFLLITETPGINGQIEESYIQGYSEYAERSFKGTINPNILFFINSITRVDKLLDPAIGAYRSRVLSTFNVITTQFGGTRYQEVENNIDFKLIRPSDILTGINNMDAYSTADYLIDTGRKVDTEAQTSSRGNSNGLKYITNTINKFIEARSTCELGIGGRKEIIREAANNSTETNLFSIPLLMALHIKTGEYTPSNFTLATLSAIDPNVFNVIIDPSFRNNNYIVETKLGQPNFINTLNVSEMLNPKLETLIALKTANTINSLMCDNLISIMGLMITNVNGTPEIIPGIIESFIDSISDQDKIMSANRIIAKIRESLIPDITMSNQIILEISFYSDMLGDTVIGIKCSTGYSLTTEETIYRLPTFADSLYSPMVANTATKQTLQNDFSNITELTYVGR